MNYYLVYISAAAKLYSPSHLDKILTVSRKNNTKSNISGILLCHDGSILQVLGGEKQTVTDLHHKIKKDERHRDIIWLVQGTSEDRNFGEWSMGFKAVSHNDWNKYEGYIKADTASLLSLIKQKNPKIDATVKLFVTRTMSR